MMEEKNRKIGIDIIGDVPWGTHLCQFYQTKEDLVDILVPYFKAGLENNEFCMWVVSEPLNQKKVKKILKRAVPDFELYLKRGQIEIVSYTNWYLKDGRFNLHRVFNGWMDKLNQALAKGYDGIRVTGNTAWLEKKDWKIFTNYEAGVNNTIDKYKIIAMCTYFLDKCGASEIIDVVSNHRFAFIRREGKWEIIQSAEVKQREEKIKKLSFAIGQSIDGIAMADLESRLTYINDAFARIHGFLPQEMIGMKVENLHNQQQMDDFKQEIKQIKTRGDWDGEIAHIRKDGSSFPVFMSVTLLKDEQGEPIGILIICRDITERKKAEEEIKQIAEEWQTTFNSVSDMVSIQDKDYKLVGVNKAYADTFGVKPEELVGKYCYETIHGTKEPWPNCPHKQVLETKKPIREEFFEPNLGVYLEISASPIFNEKGEVTGTIHITKEITERKGIEKEIKYLKEYNENILESSPSLIMVIKGRQVEYVNKSFISTFGKTKGDYISKDLEEALSPKIIPAFKELIQNHGRVKELEIMGRSFNVNLFIVKKAAEEEEEEEEEMRRGIIMQDVSERKKADKEKLKAQLVVSKEKAKRRLIKKTVNELKKEIEEKTQKEKEAYRLRERFIADASHELRTPLAVLQTNLDLLSSLGISKTSLCHKDFTDLIEGSKCQIKNLTTIIEELSLLSRGKKPEELREKIILAALIQETAEELRALAEVKDVNYKVKILDQDLAIMGDEGMLRKLIKNLISNAIKYGRRKGKIEIILKKRKGGVKFQIRDDGVGISKKDLSYIFERFYRTDKGRSKEKGGIGLGLAICKWIVELHGGEIEVESKYGKGSTFTVSLPLKGSWEDKIGFWDYKSRKKLVK